ncbi:glycosyltransferase family 87 protein [Dactylosporangium sp. CS-047395]|uniref:glycosyltransferase family 87 protein n=1 Tax=Dactylosporangium sp. CS-047395 TaxID=3239936 RepID=UPI003D8E4E0C
MLKSRAPWLVLCGAYALLVQELVRISLSGRMHSMDNLLVVDAVRRLAEGGSPYESARFLYPPSSVLFAWPLTGLSDAQLERLFPWGLAALLLLGWWASLRLFGVGLRSWLGVAGVAAFGLFNPAVSVVELGNWTAPVAASMAVALLLMGRGRWVAAGVVIGVSIAVKPMLVPIGLVFLLARQWRGLAVAAGVPVAVCAIVAPLLPEPGLFFTRTLPFLLGGQDEFARPYDSSLPAMLPRIGIDGAPLAVVRIAVLAVALATAWWRWRTGGDERLRLVDTCAILMIGTFLVSTPAFGYYPLVVLPPLVASVLVRGSAARSVWFWIALVPLVRPIQFIGVDFLDGGHAGYRQAAKPLAWMAVAGTLLLVRTWRAEPAAPPPALGPGHAAAAPLPERDLAARLPVH